MSQSSRHGSCDVARSRHGGAMGGSGRAALRLCLFHAKELDASGGAAAPWRMWKLTMNVRTQKMPVDIIYLGACFGCI